MSAPSKKRVVLVGILLLLELPVLAAGWVGCHSARPARTIAAQGSPATAPAEWFGSTRPPAGQTLAFNNSAEPEHLDPAIMAGQPDGRIARIVFEGLCVPDPKTLEPRPGQAYRWDVSPDRLVYTFHLRPGLTWSDGHPLTARDFWWSWLRVLVPATASRYASLLFPIRNAEDFNQGRLADPSQVGIAAPDDSTFVVTLAHPTPYFLELTTFYTTLPTPRHVIEWLGPQWESAHNLVGNGAFRIANWRQKDKFTFVPNERYWDRAHVRLTRIDVYAIDDLSTSTNLYKAGVLDWSPSGNVPKPVIPFLQHYADYRSGPFHAIYFFGMNVRRKPFDNVWVRRALNAATDRDAIARYVLKGTVPAWGNMTPAGYAGYTAPPPLTYDPDKARADLARAGYPDGRGFPKIEILFNTSEDHRRIAEALQAMWTRTLHIPVALSNQEWASYLAATSNFQYDVARRSWIGDFLDPMTFLDMWKSDSGNNRTGWSDARYDALVTQARAEPDPAKRLGLLSRAEAILLADGPAIPIYHYTESSLVKPYVRGIESTLLDEHPLTHVWIAP